VMNGKGHPLPELVNPNQLAQRYAMHSDAVLKVLQKAGLKATAEWKIGRGSLRLFKRDEALPALEKHKAQQNAASNPTPAKDHMASVTARLDEQDEHIQTLIKGNQALFGLVQQISQHTERLVRELSGSKA
jgi:hypothetical protein